MDEVVAKAQAQLANPPNADGLWSKGPSYGERIQTLPLKLSTIPPANIIADLDPSVRAFFDFSQFTADHSAPHDTSEVKEVLLQGFAEPWLLLTKGVRESLLMRTL